MTVEDSSELEDEDKIMYDASSTSPELEDEDEIMYDASSTDGGNWDPTDVTPPTTSIHLGPNLAVADTNNNGADMMDIDTPDYQPSNSPQTPPTWATFNQTTSTISPSSYTRHHHHVSTTMSSPYTHGHPVLYTLDAENEVDKDGDFIMKSAPAEF